MNNPRTDAKTLISALRILARDIESEDGVANAAIAEAADRLQEMTSTLNRICTWATVDSSDDFFPYYGRDGLKLIAKEARRVLRNEVSDEWRHDTRESVITAPITGPERKDMTIENKSAGPDPCAPVCSTADTPTCGVLRSKPTQIQAVSQPGDCNSGPHVQLFALCEDGSIWVQFHSSGFSNVTTDGLWRMIQPPAGWEYSSR